MRIARPLSSLVVLAASLASAPSVARADDYVRDGWYAGARGVFADTDFDTQGDTSNGFGFNLFAGWRAFRGLASDFEFEFVRPVSVDVQAAPNFDVRNLVLSWNFRVYPLAWVFAADSPLQRVQPYLTAGPSLQWAQFRDSNRDDKGGFAGRLGGGFDVYLTPHLALTADAKYTLGTDDLTAYRYWSVGWGFVYRFDSAEGGGGGGGGGHGEDDKDEE